MKIVFVIALLTALGEHKGMYTGPDGTVAVFNSADACQTVLHQKKLDAINVLGTHGQCEKRLQDNTGRLSAMGRGKH